MEEFYNLPRVAFTYQSYSSPSTKRGIQEATDAGDHEHIDISLRKSHSLRSTIGGSLGLVFWTTVAALRLCEAGGHDGSDFLLLGVSPVCKQNQAPKAVAGSGNGYIPDSFQLTSPFSTQTENLKPTRYLPTSAYHPTNTFSILVTAFLSLTLLLFAMTIPPFSVPHTWASQSVQDSLTAANPTLNVTVNPANLVPTNAADLDGAQIMRWDQFNIDSLRQAYGDILDRYPVPTVIGHHGPHAVNGLRRFKQVFMDNLFPRLAHPIQTGATVLGARLGAALPNVSIEKDTVVDWPRRSGLSLVSDDGTHFLVGCVLMESQWDSTRLESSHYLEDLAFLPLRRVATYCLATDTRYGFVLTPGEVVVVRVSGTAYDYGQPCRIEWQAVPWGASGPDTLTAVAPRAAPPLNLWLRYQDPAGVAAYKHHLSLRQAFCLPAGAPVDDATPT
ncbi:hypothetical protein RAB80_003578 [Fusarium oxysporum f. sp. vasinfectum]|nr:hypothetical protein RAB80_003578 [Fusarium oxysporum f. sp. vasinfectum]KAK2933782.1 hypothetical protein FoTM2_005026 [Fusarium oxysporum f. sp. vasinfectum]